MFRNQRAAVTAFALLAPIAAGNAIAACYDVAAIARPADEIAAQLSKQATARATSYCAN